MILQELKELHQIINDKLNGKSNIVDLGKELDKLIPKKPLKQECDFFDLNLVCPECKNRIVNVWNKREYKPNYCHYCGQALDWSENNGRVNKVWRQYYSYW